MFALIERSIVQLKPRKRPRVSVWSQMYRILDSKGSAESGAWRNERTPYLVEIMDQLGPDSPVQQIFVRKGSQLGFTEIGNNWMGFIMDEAPGPAMMVLPTLETVKDNSKIRIDTMIRATPRLRNKVKGKQDKDSTNNTFMKEFPGGYLVISTANSPAALSSKPICYAYLDEWDRYKEESGDEGDPFRLIEARTQTFGSRRKIFVTSTPSTAGSSRIDRAIDKHCQVVKYFFVPCPHCQQFQVLRFSNLKWELDQDGMPTGVHYECEHCNKQIQNHQKDYMLANGEWRAVKGADIKRPRSIGYDRISSLYSPVGWLSWERIAQIFIEVKGNPAELKVFINTILGESWEESGDAPDWEKLYKRREQYNIGQVPAGGLILTAGVDVQKDRIEVQIKAWGRENENWTVRYDVYPGNPDEPEVWKHLDELLISTFRHEYGIEMPINCLAIDSGYNSQAVYRWARRYPVDRVIAIKGYESLAVPIGQPRAVDVKMDGRRIPRGVKLWPVGVNILKRELYGWLRKEEPGAGFCHHPDLPDEFFKQLTAEYLTFRLDKGKFKKWFWKKHYDRNEALDTSIYARAAAIHVGIDRMPEQNWQNLEQAMGRPANREAPIRNANQAPQQLMPRRRRPRTRRRIHSYGIDMDNLPWH